MVTIKHKGNFKNLERFLDRVYSEDFYAKLDEYAQQGVDALSGSTPEDSGLTASSWECHIDISYEKVSIEWHNTNLADGIPIVILLQYGHGTGTGGYVVGRDFINPTIKPIFDEIEDYVWKEMTKK